MSEDTAVMEEKKFEGPHWDTLNEFRKLIDEKFPDIPEPELVEGCGIDPDADKDERDYPGVEKPTGALVWNYGHIYLEVEGYHDGMVDWYYWRYPKDTMCRNGQRESILGDKVKNDEIPEGLGEILENLGKMDNECNSLDQDQPS